MFSKFRGLFLTILLTSTFLLHFASSASAVNVLTQHNDMARTGQNLSETTLTTADVNVNTFGKLFARSVDGQIYAQPLYLPNLTINGTVHNVVFVATMHNSVYAFDADNPAASTPLWQVNLGTSVPSTDISSTYRDITPEIGILATPVIDPVNGLIYVVAKTKNTANSTYHFNLHALDVTSGAERLGGPVEITAQVNGTGDGSVGGVVTLDPLHHLNRPGLLLMNGVLYIAFGSVGDIFPYHGWVLSYNASTLQRTNVFNVTPNGSQGAIWQAGTGLTADPSGNIYLMTGNGTFDANTGGTSYGDSFLKISTASGLSVADYFTPFNQADLSSRDLDLGSGGPLLIPNSNLIVGMGKDGVLRLLNTANMGGYNTSTDNIVQEFQALPSGNQFMGNPIYWSSPNNGPVIYVWGPNDFLKAYQFNGSTLQTTPVSQSTMTEFGGQSNTVPLSLSANGSQPGTGIVWASAAYNQDPNQQTVGGIMRAFDAGNLSVELWNSKQNTTRDDVGSYAKFCPPTVANGKVYLATFSNQLLVYGLLGLNISTPALSSGVIGQTYTQTLTATGGQSPYSWSIISGNLPPGLSLNPSTGVISGTPTTAGTSNFTIQVQDATQATASKPFSITIFSTAPSLAMDVNVSADSSATGTTITSPTFTTGAAGELLVAFIGGSSPGTGTNTSVQSVTNTGGALTWTKGVITNAQQGTSEIWWALANSPITGTVTATMSQSVSSRSITVLSFIGADTPGATGSGNALSGAPSASLVTTRDSSWVFGTGNDWTSAVSRTLGTGQSMVHQFLSTATADTYWVQNRSATTPTAGTTVTINDTAPTTDRYNLSLIEIRPILNSTATAVSSVSLQPSSVTGGSTSTGTVTLNAPAPSGGAQVTVTSASPTVASVTSPVTVPAGSTSTTFAISTTTVATSTLVSISANYGNTPAQSAILTVNPPAPLSITTTSLPGGTVGSAYNQMISATGGVTPYTWSISAGSLPPGLGINPSTGVISGTPTAPGTSNFTVRVVDNNQTAATQNLSIVISSPPTGIAVDVNVSTDSSVTGAVITSPTVTTSTGNELLIAFISGAAPVSGTNTTVTGVTNTGTPLTWTRAVVTNVQRGTAEIWWAYTTSALNGTVTATLNQSVSSRSITVMTFTGTASGADAIGATGSGNASAAAPTASLVTTRASSWVFGTGNDWSGAVGRTVGANQTLVHQYLSTATGDTYWVQRQTAPTPNSGTTVTINDTSPTNHMYNLSILEIRAPSGPVPLSITTSALTSGTVGVAYPGQNMVATGGTPPYTWSASGLPPGLSISSGGAISGTPTAAGTFTITFQVTDSVQGTVNKNLNMTISPVTLAIDASVSTDFATTSSTMVSPTFTTHSANELLVAFITASTPSTGPNTTVTSVTNTGTPLVWTRAVITNVQQGTAEIWWAYATGTLTGTVTANLNHSVSSGSITVLTFTGTASGANAIGAIGSGNSASGAPTASLVTTRANSWVFGTANDWNAAISRVVGPNQTMVHQFLSPTTGDTYWVQSQTAVTPAAGTTVTINDTSPTTDRYNLSIVEIRTP